MSSASTALWAHLRKQDVPVATPDATCAPIAPIDKNATSMRILLHDTSHNLEKFSERVDKLTSRVDEAKEEIVAVNKLFQGEHQALAQEVVDLANRCQTGIQKSLGNPAQASQLDDLRKDLSSIDHKLEAIDKRIDLLHTLNQTHAQTLQIQAQNLQAQTQTLHTLQEQYGNIMSTLSPLLPLLQAVPLHVETIRSCVAETILKHVRMTEHRTDDSKPSLSSGPGPSYISSPRKRIRLDDTDETCKLSGDGSRLAGKILWPASSKRPLSISPKDSGSDASLRPRPRVPVSTVSSPLQNRQSITENVSESRTPRRRLNGLPLPMQHSNTPAISDNLSLKSLSLQELSGNVSRDPKRSRASDIHQSVRMQSGSSASTIASDTNPEQNPTNGPEALPRLHPAPNQLTDSIKPPFPEPFSSGPGQDHTTPMQQPELTGIHHGNSTPVSRLIAHGSSNRQRTTTPYQPPQGHAPLFRLQDPPRAPVPFRPPVSRHEHVLGQNMPMQSNGFPAQIAGKPMSIKDRRARGWLALPANRVEGKRFIPLGDDDDDDDDLEL